jgi:hypothetical protein
MVRAGSEEVEAEGEDSGSSNKELGNAIFLEFCAMAV